jgi:hypothetical protein
MTPAMLEETVHLFAVRDTVQRVTWQFAAQDYLFGQRNLQSPDPPSGMLIRYYLRSPSPDCVSVAIAGAGGRESRGCRAAATPGSTQSSGPCVRQLRDAAAPARTAA